MVSRGETPFQLLFFMAYFTGTGAANRGKQTLFERNPYVENLSVSLAR
jgi:hypothetical protein